MQEFYILELSVKPGGARKHHLHVLPTLASIYRTLQEDLVKDVELAIWYGQEILLHRCRLDNYKGHVIETIDLHDKITFYIGNFEPIRFDKTNKIIGYHKSQLFDTNYKHTDDPSPIDFTSKDIQEVYRYLNYDIYEVFRIMKQRNINGSNMERYPPNVGVQIDLSSIPRIEEPLRYLRENIHIPINNYTYELSKGFNDLGG